MEEVHYLDYLQLKIFAPQTKTHNIFGVKNCEIRLPINMNYIYIFHKVLFQLGTMYMVIFLHTRFFKSSWAWLSDFARAIDACLRIFRFVLCRNLVLFGCLRNFLLTARKLPRACPEMSHQSQMSGEKDLWLCHHVKFMKWQFEGYRGVAVGVGLLTHLGDGLSAVLKRQECEQSLWASFVL